LTFPLVIGAEENYGTLGTTGLYAFFGNGQGNWTQHTITTTGSYAYIEIVDVDNDGYNEVFAGCQENSNGIEAWEWNGTQFLTSGISSPITSGNVNYFRIENISGTSSLDIAVARNGGIRYYEGSGSSPITWTEYSTGLRTRGLCTSIDVSDLNDDGLLDILVGQYGDGLFAYTQNSGSVSWNDETDTLPSVEHSGRILGVVTGDVNEDGNIDLIYGRRTNPQGLFLLLGNGGGTSGDALQWTYLNDSWTSRPWGSFYQMNLQDVDSDGDLDLLVAKEDTGLHLYLGDGSEDPGNSFTWSEVTGKGLPTDMKFFGSNYFDYDNDGDLDIAGCTWGYGARVYQNNETKPAEPIARAGMDITVFFGDPVTLDGTNSSDAQDCAEGDAAGTILTYDWNLTSQPEGSMMADTDLSPSDSDPGPTFTPTLPGNYTFTLSVQDTEGYHSRSEDEIRISVILNNTDPTANAGPDQTVFTGDMVYLNGSLSTDLEDTIEQLGFHWEVNSSNPSLITLDDPSLKEPSFTAPDTTGVYKFTLRVTDSFNYSSQLDEVNITVTLRPNVDPVADAGDDIQGIANSSISLDGTGSSDSDGEIITWVWNCTSHNNISLADGNSSTPEFTPNISDEYSFTLQVIDDRGGMSNLDTVLVTITPDNSPPTANAGKNLTVNVNTSVILNGTLSRDPEGTVSEWEWNSTSHPGVLLNNSNSATPDFFASEIGEYHFKLRVGDDRGMWSWWDHVKITVLEEDVNITDPVENTAPTVEVTSPMQGMVLNGTFDLVWSATDVDGDPLTILIELISLPGASTVILFDGPNPDQQNLRIDSKLYSNGTYELRIRVYDGFDDTIVHIQPIQIRNEEETVADDDDDDDDDTVDDDDAADDDEQPPIDDPDEKDKSISIQMIIGIIVVILIAGLLIFAVGRWIYERRDDEDTFDLDEE